MGDAGWEVAVNWPEKLESEANLPELPDEKRDPAALEEEEEEEEEGDDEEPEPTIFAIMKKTF